MTLLGVTEEEIVDWAVLFEEEDDGDEEDEDFEDEAADDVDVFAGLQEVDTVSPTM